MFDNLTLYYLKQIGIVPWVKKESHAYASSQLNLIKLVVLHSVEFHDKAKLLLDRMINYIGILESQKLLINIAQSENWSEEIVPLSSVALLTLGFMPSDLSIQWSGPTFFTLDPEELLLDPAMKKQAFNELSVIRNLVINR